MCLENGASFEIEIRKTDRRGIGNFVEIGWLRCAISHDYPAEVFRYCHTFGEADLTFDDLEAWRREMGWSVTGAAEAIGISTRAWYRYGEDRDAELPAYIGYSCFCLYHRHDQWSGPSSTGRAARRRKVSRASLANLKRGQN